MRRYRPIVMTGCALLAAAGVVAATEIMPVRKSTLVTISTRVEVKASPAKVWKTLCSVEGFCAITGFKPVPGQKLRSFARVGDALSAGIWTDTGRLIVTYLSPDRELRVAFEPENASYLCSSRVILKPSGDGTSVEFTDRYSDDQATVDQTARQVFQETMAAVEAFKLLAEKQGVR